MNTEPMDDLELRALDQRNQIHRTATELKKKVVAVQHKLDPVGNARQHFAATASVVGAVGLLLGYATGGIFTKR